MDDKDGTVQAQIISEFLIPVCQKILPLILPDNSTEEDAWNGYQDLIDYSKAHFELIEGSSYAKD